MKLHQSRIKLVVQALMFYKRFFQFWKSVHKRPTTNDFPLASFLFILTLTAERKNEQKSAMALFVDGVTFNSTEISQRWCSTKALFLFIWQRGLGWCLLYVYSLHFVYLFAVRLSRGLQKVLFEMGQQEKAFNSRQQLSNQNSSSLEVFLMCSW